MIDLLVIETGGTSQKVAFTTTSAQSAAVSANRAFLVVDTPCFVRQGSNPTAVADGTDQYLPANVPMRVSLPSGAKLAFVALTGSGNAYITPIPRTSGY